MRGYEVNWFNWNTVAAQATVTPGASNAEGSYTTVATSAEVAFDVYMIEITVLAGATTANIKNHLLDIGIDPAGGTSFTAVINNIVCGQSGTSVQGGIHFIFPFYVKAGYSIGARIQGSNATAGTVLVQLKLYGKPSNPELCLVGQYSETIGTIASSNGTSFTPGNSSAEGSWVSLGTTTKDLWWWQLCCQAADGTSTALLYNMDLAYGDGSNKHMIIENSHFSFMGSAEAMIHMPDWGYCEVPSGSTLYVRGTCSGTADATGWGATAVGIGG